MRFSLHLRQAVKDQIQEMAQAMADWDIQPRIDAVEQAKIGERLISFPHTTKLEGQVISAVDGSGDFPLLSYADSFVYLSTAQAVRYEAVGDKLQEIGPEPLPLVDVCWLPEHEQQRLFQLDAAFVRLAGGSLEEIIEQSDYRQLQRQFTGRELSLSEAIDDLIRPHSSDSANLGIQLRSCVELGAALRLIAGAESGEIVLLDGTLALPSYSGQRARCFKSI